jgi:hypothetical protein
MDRDDTNAATAFFAQEFGERSYAQGANFVADCRIPTADRHKEDFVTIRVIVMAKCWKRLQTEVGEDIITRILELYGMTLEFQVPNVELKQIKAVEHLADDVLNSLLSDMISHIAISQIEIPCAGNRLEK